MRQILIDIVKCGILAPSADNEHIFRIELGANFIRLWPAVAFASNRTLHRRVLGHISLGAVLANMQLRAAELGFLTEVEFHSDLAESTPLARVDIRPSGHPMPSELAESIRSRCTNRRMYKGPALSRDEFSALNSVLDSVAEVRLLKLEGDARRKALGLIWRAESERFLRKALHEEIFSSIRFDLHWDQVSDSALPPGALEIEYPMRPLFKLLRHWWLMKFLTHIGVHHLIGLRAGWLPCWQAPGLFVIATKRDPQLGAIEVGAALQRVWLKATSLGLALQPLAASAVLPLQADLEGGASESLREKLNAGWQTICPDVHPLMIFRIGRAKPPTIRASRKDLAHYLYEPNV